MFDRIVYILIDCSKSMQGENANTINTFMDQFVNDFIPQLRLTNNADVRVFFRVIGFASRFPNGVLSIKEKTELDDFNQWEPIGQNYYGSKPAKGAALNKVIEEIKNEPSNEWGSTPHPIILLLSNGDVDCYEPSFEEIMECDDKDDASYFPPFNKAYRIAIGINPKDNNAVSNLKKFGHIFNPMNRAKLQEYMEYDSKAEFDWGNLLYVINPAS